MLSHNNLRSSGDSKTSPTGALQVLAVIGAGLFELLVKTFGRCGETEYSRRPSLRVLQLLLCLQFAALASAASDHWLPLTVVLCGAGYAQELHAAHLLFLAGAA